MPDGRVLNDSHISGRVVMIDAASAADDGQWIDVERYRAASIHFISSGGAAFTIQVRGSSAEVKPANNTQGAQIGADVVIAANGEQLFALGGFPFTENLPWYFKVRISAYTSGTLTAIAVLRAW